MIKNIVESHLIPAEGYIFGFASLEGLLNKKFENFHYGICIGKKLDDRIIDSISEGPSIEYFNLYKRTNNELAEIAGNISIDLKKNGIDTINIPPSTSTNELETVYASTLRTELSHKMVATRAGLGWIGKTDLFISREFGPRLRLVSILTNTPLSSQKEAIDRSLCGKCRICVDICPANAAKDMLWDTETDRDEFFDAHKCRAQCREFGRTRLNSDILVCGICVSACPISNKKS